METVSALMQHLSWAKYLWIGQRTKSSNWTKMKKFSIVFSPNWPCNYTFEFPYASFPKLSNLPHHSPGSSALTHLCLGFWINSSWSMGSKTLLYNSASLMVWLPSSLFAENGSGSPKPCRRCLDGWKTWDGSKRTSLAPGSPHQNKSHCLFLVFLIVMG